MSELLRRCEAHLAQVRSAKILTREMLQRGEVLLEELREADRRAFLTQCDEVFAKYEVNFDEVPK